jgi:DNA helicase-2/ATP-dependent DNA helicase PcrA
VSAATPDAGLAEFVAVLDERAAMQHAPTVDGVTLASLHAAKGLEWDAVFLVGLVDGTVPITYATTPAQVEEERRLLYVGITRAREHLTFSWATARNPGSRGQRRPSRFLDGLRPGEATPTAGRTSTAGSRRRKGAARCRVCGRALTTAVERKLRHCSECEVDVDLELFERLREWRREEAQRTSVPAYVVFTDVTLTAIAQDRPSSEVELVGVPGVGPSKLARYGPAVLAVVAGEWTGHADVE